MGNSNKVWHNGRFRSFVYHVKRGDGWGYVGIRDDGKLVCHQCRHNAAADRWETTGELEDVRTFVEGFVE